MTALKTNTSCTDTSTEFVELLAKSNFSFLHGASHPEEMALRAQQLGYAGLGLCDLNGLYGVVRAFQAVEYPSKFMHYDQPPKPLRLHAGAELLFHPLPGISAPFSLSLIPMNKEGYFHLCQLITISKRRSPKGFSQLLLEDLMGKSEFLFAFAHPPWTENVLERLQDIFGDHLFLPVHKDYTWESVEQFQKATNWEARLGIPIVATSRPLMHARERKPLHDVLTCILHKTTLDQARTRLTSNSERHLKTLSELKLLWNERPDALKRTKDISDRIHFTLHELRYEYPRALDESQNSTQTLRELTFQGLRKRFPEGVPKDVHHTVERELTLIAELQYEDYFLTLWDVCQFASRQGILHQGRGSAANSIVCYALGLTAVNPTTITLIFERFLSRERGEPPDIDIDFQSDRREEVIQYIYQKYGHEYAAMVCTVVCYRSRLALRECAKVLGIPLATVNFLIKFMGREGFSRLKENPELHLQTEINEKTYRLLLQTTAALVGFPRHLGIHSGGFLISRRPIFECVPVEKATMDQRYVIQWNKDDLNVLKMMKIDVLGLGMLGALNQCFKLLKQHRGVELDLYSIPPEDKATYDMICQADTVGVFQIESRAQMSLLPRLQPRKFYDLVVEVAIVRPGPIQSGMVHPFIRRRHGQEKVEYAHPDLIPILQRTYGVPIFQEQIMQIASSVCGFTPGEADELRRIMSSSWKKNDLMLGLRNRILNGMVAHGITAEYAERIYQTIVGFSSYGFPESHAASFALLTYASCYLKWHHPDIFVCALLNSQPMGFYSPRALINDATRHGVTFLDIDVQHSDYEYTLEISPRTVRVGFCSLYGVKENKISPLITERRRGGPFKDLTDLVRRTSVDRRTLLLLASSGALKSFGKSARETLWQAQGLKMDPQNLFFGQSLSARAGHIPEENGPEEMSREYKSMGFSIHKHPLQFLRPQLNTEQPRAVTSRDLKRIPNGCAVCLGGLIEILQRPPTAKGFCFLTMEDEVGSFNVLIVPKIYERYRLDLMLNPLIKIYGQVEKKSGVIHVRAHKIEPLRPP